MALRTGKVIIAKNIKLDKNYKDVLDYSESDMLALVNANKVAEVTSASFLRVGENVIDTSFSYSDCLKCNYMAIQNPNYSNKWFFCFIDDIEYINNGTTRIKYTIDEFSTWYDYWLVEDCFVIREHVNDDTVGLHTLPENVETGEYIVDSKIEGRNFAQVMNVIVASTVDLDGTTFDAINGTEFGGIYSGVKYYEFNSINSLNLLLEELARAGKSEAITSMFMGCSVFYDTDNATSSRVMNIVRDSGSVKTTPWSYTVLGGQSIVPPTKPTTLNGYTPKNKKMLTFPFCYLMASNNAGSNAIYKYELFSTTNCDFRYIGVITPGMSIRLQPLNYNNQTINNEEGLNLGKFPVCGWNTDVYTNWLTQNSVNVPVAVGSGLLSMIGGAVSGNPIAVGAGMLSIASSIGAVYQHSLTPPQAEGNINNGDVTFSSGNLQITMYKMTIRRENAECIDNFLTKYGYKINRIKTPNLTGRTYWNYVQIGDTENIGYSTISNKSTPAKSMEIINNIFRNGVTIWHNHANLGNYALNNTIVQ